MEKTCRQMAKEYLKFQTTGKIVAEFTGYIKAGKTINNLNTKYMPEGLYTAEQLFWGPIKMYTRFAQ